MTPTLYHKMIDWIGDGTGLPDTIEIMDRLTFGSWRWEDTSLDILNTLLWPTVICLGVRLRPMIGKRRR